MKKTETKNNKAKSCGNRSTKAKKQNEEPQDRA